MEIRKGGSNLLDRLFNAFLPSHLWMRMIYPAGGKHFISPFHVSCIPHSYIVPHKGLIRLTIHTFSLRKRFSLFFHSSISLPLGKRQSFWHGSAIHSPGKGQLLKIVHTCYAFGI